MYGKDEFKHKLRAELERHATLDQAIFGSLLVPPPNWELLRLTATQGYQLTCNFLEYVETLYSHCPKGPHKRRLLVNLFEEETGHLSRTKNHVTLMQDFLAAIGIGDAERDAVVALPATRELIDYRMNLVRNPGTFHLGAAAVMVASEGQNLETSEGYPRHKFLIDVYGLTERDVLFFSVHQKEDVGHVREGIEAVVDACRTRQMQEDALTVVGHTCRLFRNMYESIWEEYQRSVACRLAS